MPSQSELFWTLYKVSAPQKAKDTQLNNSFKQNPNAILYDETNATKHEATTGPETKRMSKDQITIDQTLRTHLEYQAGTFNESTIPCPKSWILSSTQV